MQNLIKGLLLISLLAILVTISELPLIEPKFSFFCIVTLIKYESYYVILYLISYILPKNLFDESKKLSFQRIVYVIIYSMNLLHFLKNFLEYLKINFPQNTLEVHLLSLITEQFYNLIENFIIELFQELIEINSIIINWLLK